MINQKKIQQYRIIVQSIYHTLHGFFFFLRNPSSALSSFSSDIVLFPFVLEVLTIFSVFLAVGIIFFAADLTGYIIMHVLYIKKINKYK